MLKKFFLFIMAVFMAAGLLGSAAVWAANGAVAASAAEPVPTAAPANEDYGLTKFGQLTDYNTDGDKDITTIVQRAVNGALAVSFLVFFGLTLYAGIRWMTAHGNEDLATKAKDTLTNSIIGLFVIIASYGITTLIFSLFTG